MKELLKRHGEKIFLGLMILVCGWSLVGSAGRLRLSIKLSDRDEKDIATIRQRLKEAVASPRQMAPYQKWIGGNFAGHGRYADRGDLPTRGFYAIPLEGTGGDDGTKPVPGELGRPTGLAAKGFRARADVTWTAAAIKNANVVRYLIFGCKGEGERPKEPLGFVAGGRGTCSFTASNLDPETKYSYWVLAVGRPAPPDEKKHVVPPANVTVNQEARLWFTEPAGPAFATTLSNVDFECVTIYDDFGDRAVIRVKRWNSATNDWDVFVTEGGLAEGGRIIGKRTVKYQTETFDSGYVLKNIKRESRTVVEWKDVLVEDPPGSGKIVKKRVKVERKVPIHVLHIEKADGSRKLTLEYWPGGKKARAKVEPGKPRSVAVGKPPAPTPSKPKSAGGDILDEMKKRMETAAAGRPQPRKPAVAGQKPAAPDAPAGLKRVRSGQTGASVLVPEGWTGGLELDHIVKTRLLMWYVSDGDLVDNFGGSTPGSGLVVAHTPAGEKELAALVGRATEGLSADEIVGLVSEGFKKRGLEKVPQAKARGENWSVRTKADRPVAAFAITASDEASKLVVARYCAVAPSHVHMLTFVCKEGDFDAQKGAFDDIAKTIAW